MGRVKITTFGLLKSDLPAGLEVEPGQTVAEVVKKLGLHFGEGIIPLVNGRLASFNTVLDDGDELELVQSVGGGA